MMAGNKKIFLLVCLVLLCLTRSTVGKPRPSKTAMGWNAISSDIKYCSRDIQVQELCQRCAKITKSDIVYPMCCANEDNGYVWCIKYLNFGLQ